MKDRGRVSRLLIYLCHAAARSYRSHLDVRMRRGSSFSPEKWLMILCACASALMAGELSPLRTDGSRLVDPQGNAVLLRGVNLGGWLVFEPWMTPMDASGLKDDHSARELLEKRFGWAKAEELIGIYQDHYITERDFDHIKAAGLNCIRLPFWYRNLQKEDGTWLENAFRRMDWCVAEAAKRGIYTILDLHGAPGGQSHGESTGRIRKPEHNGISADFWTNEKQIRRTEEIWKRVAAHYQGRPEIAALDLLNEPYGAPSRQRLHEVYERLYRAVREVDPRVIISLETCWSGKEDGVDYGWGWNVLPAPQEKGWKHVLYQLHNYEWDWKNREKQIASTDRQIRDLIQHRSWNVPALMGEFNCMGHEQAWKHAIGEFEKHGMSWTMWNYKATHGPGDDSWGLYNIRKDAPPRPHLRLDSADVIAERWKSWSTEKAFLPNPMLHRVLIPSGSPR